MDALDFRLLFEAAPYMLTVSTPELVVAAVSDTALAVTGKQRDEMVGRGFFEVFPEDPDDQDSSAATLRPALDRVLRLGVTSEMPILKYNIERPESDGGGFEERFWTVRHSPVFGTDGRVAYVITTSEDVTELAVLREQIRNAHDADLGRGDATSDITSLNQLALMRRSRAQAEAQLSQVNQRLAASEAMFRVAMEHAPVGMALVGLDGRYMQVNRSLCEMLGYSNAELLELSITDVTFPADRDAHREAQERLLSGAVTAFRIDERYVHRDGAVIDAELMCTLAPASGSSPAYFIKQITDMTEITHARRLLEEQRAAAERANEAKSEFLSRMSHELRTPLNSILGFAQLLELQELSDGERDSVSYILKGGRHLLALINDVLDISRIEAGRLGMSVEAVNLTASAVAAVEFIGPMANERSITIGARAPEADVWVVADSRRVTQVLLNLLSNAIKYTPVSGLVEVSIEVRNGRAMLTVSDNGPGIPPESLPKLFVPFERLGADATATEGAGIGLALAQGLVEAMNGTIEVSSVVGEGSSFTVVLPAGVAPGIDQVTGDRDRAITDGTHDSAAAKIVLYVEDNRANTDLMAKVLAQRPGLRLVTAATLAMGRERIREQLPDLVLLDLHLPDGHGQELLAELRVEQATRETPVVVLTADAMPGQRTSMLAAGANDYLTKPLEITKTLELIDRILSQP